MSIGDRVFTPQTARALLSWRIVLGAVIGLVAALLGMGAGAAAGLGLAVYAATVVAGITAPSGSRTVIDPFALSEPWRRFVQHAQRARTALHDTLRGAADGPLKDRLVDVAERLDGAIEESWSIAKRGDEIDEAINRIDPVRLRSQLATLRAAGDDAGDSTAAAVESVESQLASADRLKVLSVRTAERLRLTETRLDELVARAAEVSVGRTDSEAYEHDVDNLVIELEALRQAVAETNELR
jgi:hypothetical protein